MKKIIKWLLLASLSLGMSQLALTSAQAADATSAAPSATSSAEQAEQPPLAERQAKAEKKMARLVTNRSFIRSYWNDLITIASASRGQASLICHDLRRIGRDQIDGACDITGRSRHLDAVPGRQVTQMSDVDGEINTLRQGLADPEDGGFPDASHHDPRDLAGLEHKRSAAVARLNGAGNLHRAGENAGGQGTDISRRIFGVHS